MRVVVDLLFYTGTRGGMESYIRSMYPLMPREDFEYVALASTELAATDTGWFPGRVVDSGISGANRAAWAFGELTAVPRWAKRLGADLIHSPANVGPWRSTTPVVLTVQDLLPFRHPEFVPGRYSRLLRLLVGRAARHARRVLTISEQSRADIEHFLEIAPSSIEVIPLAGKPARGTTRERVPGTLLALGNRLPHKNFERLVRAIALIPESLRPHLVITGSSDLDPLEPVVAELGLQSFVELRGWVSNEELDRLYATSFAIVVPTLFEGFGLPVLDGMANGCPVICSDIPVLREVAGDAAVFFDPLDPASIASAVTSTLADAPLRERLRVEGLARASDYTWRRTADATASAFQRALG